MPTALKRELNPTIQELLQRQGLKDLAALSRKIGRYEQRITVYRTLLNDTKHEDLRTVYLMAQALTHNPDQPVTLEKLAKWMLDFPHGQYINSLEKLMSEAGIASRYALAKRMGVDDMTVYRIFKPTYQYIQLKVCRDISKGLGCTLDKLSEILLSGGELSDHLSDVTIMPMTNESDHLLLLFMRNPKCILSNRAKPASIYRVSA